MFKIYTVIGLFVLSVYFNTVFSTENIRVIDDKGNRVELTTPAKRIVSLAPHITESLFAAGAGEYIVGAVAYSDYPEAAKKIPRVGGYPQADLEKIISLNPDLVIAWPNGNNFKQVDKLKKLGIKIFLSEPRQPLDIAKTIRRFGILAGTTATSEPVAAEYISHYQRLLSANNKKEKVKVFYQFWNKPIMTINGNHLISKVINLCGGINVFADTYSLSSNVTVEAVLASKTDVIIAGGKGDKQLQWIAEWKSWPQLEAAKNDHIYFIDPDLLNRAGPRILEGADELCRLLDNVRKPGKK